MAFHPTDGAAPEQRTDDVQSMRVAGDPGNVIPSEAAMHPAGSSARNTGSLDRFALIPSSDIPQTRPAPDRLAHPSAHHPTHRVRPVGSLSFRAMRAIAAGLARVEQPLPRDETGDGIRSSRLIATAFYDVWLVTWPDGSGLETHDHGDVRSVLQVIDGEITETYSVCDAGNEEIVRTLKRRSVAIAEPTVVHSLSNRSGVEATTLHVYSPPLVDVTFLDFHPEDNRDAVGPTQPVSGPTRATSEDAVVPGPTPLSLVRP